MRPGQLRVPVVALTLAMLASVLGATVALPWPAMATTTLSGLLVLVAFTRVARALGIRGQEHTPHAVAGVAATGAIWYAGAAIAMALPGLGLLAGLHLLVFALGFGRPEAKAQEERAWLIAACTGAAVSLVAIGALPRDVGVPGGSALPSMLAVAMLVGAWYLGTGRMIGLLLAAGAGTLTLVLSARVLSQLAFAGELAEGMPLRLAPMLIGTAALGAAPGVVAMALRLEPMWKVLAPRVSATTRLVLVWTTLPMVAAVALLTF